MQRAGSTLQYQLTARLVEDAGLGARVEWVQPGQFPELRDRHAGDPSLKVFKSHYFTPEIEEEFRNGNARALYVYRDLRDVYVSLMKKLSRPFDSIWRNGFLSQCIEHHERWTGCSPCYVSAYEQMTSDLAGEAKRIAAFLEIPIDDEGCCRLAADYELARQKERIAAMHEDSPDTMVYGDNRVHTRELLHDNHIQSGTVEGWREELDPIEITMIEKEVGDWLTQQGYALARPRLGARDRLRAWHRRRLYQSWSSDPDA
jgi:hypothetical protein